MAAAFEDVDVAPAVDGHGPGVDQGGGAGIGAVLGDALAAIARHRRDDARLEVDHPYPPVVQVGQVEVPSPSSRAMQ